MENDPNLTDESADYDTSKIEDGLEEDGSNLFMDEVNEGKGDRMKQKENDDWNESEYADSDYLVTPENSDDEAPTKPKFPQFNPNVDLHGDITLVVEQICADHVLFRKALEEFSIQHGFDYIFVKNDKWRVTTICARHCGWRIHASPTQDRAAFHVKSFNAVHNYGKHGFSSRVDAKWLAHKYLDHLRDAPDWDVVAFKKHDFPGVHHRFCVRHMYVNFKKRWILKTLKDYFFVAAGARTREDSVIRWRRSRRLTSKLSIG
ncbi:uncharacterized protein LOC120009546 isoform X1 [Tripterygium wilfordii]|uniref:uncharacterized protein LOC120009546 isoform X1 n=1 Tax=Tripterygium wilfordii TaxID=458696 RepID=UPI0018F7E7EA|nr:uncharacterized protein LOC120009546 isoform X1 [Tripterygium wilfordii]XP_038716104.1 uncharacterized protein LOC120009546 isoform X2 [Tripterygium wilfordii]XP_038716105.1 uncharacterized protein LOC120009546 isoform X1 [Tripterygium wilfordii]